ncbi:hypothetical protein ACN20G_19435 [Streptomyces sp. BI20]|uniref:hypothetical protein n=1 Tax=Streptomyces sp. BI20 TaxID=3403460 RepID=UPI003C788C40
MAGYPPAEVVADLVECVTEGPHAGYAHRGLLRGLRDDNDPCGAWLSWSDELTWTIALRRDCLVRVGDEVCVNFHGHPGGHTPELADRVMEHVRAGAEGVVLGGA